MQALNYRRPNTAATALVTQRSSTIGVIGFESTLFGPASMLYSIEDAAREAGYFVSVVTVRSLEREPVLEAIDRLWQQDVEGLVAIAPKYSVHKRSGPGAGGPGVRRSRRRQRHHRTNGAGRQRWWSRFGHPASARPRTRHRAPCRRPGRLARGPGAGGGLASRPLRRRPGGPTSGPPGLECLLRVRGRQSAGSRPQRHGCVLRQRPDRFGSTASPARSRSAGPGRRQRRRVRRRAGSRVFSTRR